MTAHNPEIGRTSGEPQRLAAQAVHAYQWLARREWLACAVILVLTLGLRAALLPWFPVPHQPSVHDEFSYLLAGDTYAHGRLTNPPHPFWEHFETFHVLQQPTYISKYQPLQGLALAFGQKFFGQPWIGVYLSAGLMCAAICWMLQGWISPDWALLGALLFVMRVGILSYWMNSYMGGAIPAIGGALALGAVARIWKRRQFYHSITWGLGLGVLVLSRPYDASVLACATAAILVWFLPKSRMPWSGIGVRVALPALVVLVLCIAGVSYNDYRLTGHPLTLPYQAHETRYVMAPMFSIFPLRPEPEYRHAVMRQFYAGWNADEWKHARAHPFAMFLGMIFILSEFFFGSIILFLVVLFCPLALKTSEERVTAFLCLVFAVMIASLIGAAPHYFALFSGIFYLRFLHTLRRLSAWRPRGKALGWVLASVLAAVPAVAFFSTVGGLLLGRGDILSFVSGRDYMTRYLADRGSLFGSDRNAVIAALEQRGGHHLVIVRYSPQHDPFDEWVYNRADIDAAPIVWAREMGPQQDGPFVEYFRDRRIWLLEPDHSPPKLSPYPEGGPSQP